MRIHLQAFIRNVVKHRQGQTLVNRYVEDKTQEYSEGMRGSSIGEQYPKGLTKGVIRVHKQKSKQGQTESKRQDERAIQKHKSNNQNTD